MDETSSLLTRLKSYAHLGELAFSEEEIQEIIKSVEDDYHYRLCNYLLDAVKKKDTNALDKFQGMYHVTYQRDSFFDKLFRRKNHPVITLTAPLDQILKRDRSWKNSYVLALKNVNDNLHRQFQIRLQDRKRTQKEQDEQKRFRGRPFQDDEDNCVAAINPEHICWVHATKYYPQKNAKGEYEIQTLSTATKLKYLRNTVHGYCNGHVTSHLEGVWDDIPYVVMAPLVDLAKVNERDPAGLSAVDTFFEFDVNENLKLPNDSTFIVEPAPPIEKFEQGKYFKIGKHRAFYKTTFSNEEKKEQVASDDKIFWILPKEQQDAVLATQMKVKLVNKMLRDMGYQDLSNNNTNSDDPCIQERSTAYQKVARLGHRINVPSTAENTLHADTIFGQWYVGGGVYDSMNSAHIANMIDFMSVLTQTREGMVNKDQNNAYTFTTPKGEKHSVDGLALGALYKCQTEGSKNYLETFEEFVEEKVQKYQKDGRKISDRSQHVLDAWMKHQRELWDKSAPVFLKRYPTLNAFKKAFDHDKPVPVCQPTRHEGSTR